MPTDLAHIIEVYGPSLQTLVWEEKGVDGKTIYPNGRGYLATLTSHCPTLVALVLAWDWEAWEPPATFEDVGQFVIFVCPKGKAS